VSCLKPDAPLVEHGGGTPVQLERRKLWSVIVISNLRECHLTELSLRPCNQRFLSRFIARGVLTKPCRTLESTGFIDVNTKEYEGEKPDKDERKPETYLRHSISPFFSGMGTGIMRATGTPISMEMLSTIGWRYCPADRS
jgi:hypothetical protein